MWFDILPTIVVKINSHKEINLSAQNYKFCHQNLIRTSQTKLYYQLSLNKETTRTSMKLSKNGVLPSD